MTKNWDLYKDKMYDLYMLRGMRLAELQVIMAERYGFQASERAYKQKFKEWQWFKKTPRQSSSRLEIDYSDTDLYSDEGGRSPAMSHYGSSPGPSVSVSYSQAPSGAAASAYMDPSLPQFHYSIPQTSTSHPHGPAYTSTHLAIPGTAGQNYGAGGGIMRTSAQAYKDAFKHAITQAALLVDMGQLDDAETALEDAKRSVQWMKHYSMSG